MAAIALSALTALRFSCSQYYFETLFPRVPKPVQDDMVTKLAARGLPTKAIGNAGQGGADRRGVDEPNRRPASVKVRTVLQHEDQGPTLSAQKPGKT